MYQPHLTLPQSIVSIHSFAWLSFFFLLQHLSILLHIYTGSGSIVDRFFLSFPPIKIFHFIDYVVNCTFVLVSFCRLPLVCLPAGFVLPKSVYRTRSEPVCPDGSRPSKAFGMRRNGFCCMSLCFRIPVHVPFVRKFWTFSGDVLLVCGVVLVLACGQIGHLICFGR